MDKMDTGNNEFRINSMNTEFSNRQSQIFGQLSKLEQSVQNNLKKNVVKDDDREDEHSPLRTSLKIINKRKASVTKQFRGKESIFKRPEAPLRKCLLPRKDPDFKINPEKWKKYTLEDVTQEDISNRQNTATALTFIRELEERKTDLNAEPIETDQDFKPSFKTSALISKTDPEDDSKPLFKSSVLVMPEYTVGQRKKNSKKIKSTSKEGNRKELKLDHLLEYDDDDA